MNSTLDTRENNATIFFGGIEIVKKLIFYLLTGSANVVGFSIVEIEKKCQSYHF